MVRKKAMKIKTKNLNTDVIVKKLILTFLLEVCVSVSCRFHFAQFN